MLPWGSLWTWSSEVIPGPGFLPLVPVVPPLPESGPGLPRKVLPPLRKQRSVLRHHGCCFRYEDNLTKALKLKSSNESFLLLSFKCISTNASKRSKRHETFAQSQHLVNATWITVPTIWWNCLSTGFKSTRTGCSPALFVTHTTFSARSSPYPRQTAWPPQASSSIYPTLKRWQAMYFPMPYIEPCFLLSSPRFDFPQSVLLYTLHSFHNNYFNLALSLFI